MGYSEPPLPLRVRLESIAMTWIINARYLLGIGPAWGPGTHGHIKTRTNIAIADNGWCIAAWHQLEGERKDHQALDSGMSISLIRDNIVNPLWAYDSFEVAYYHNVELDGN